MITRRGILLALAVILLVGIAAADTTVTGGYRAMTCKGPLGLLVPLGIENFVTAQQAIFFYNFIAVGILFLMGAVASERNLRHFNILLPILAAIVVFFGWLQAPNPSSTWGIILGCGFIGGLSYMKETLRENWGFGGPGSTLINIAIYLIIFQCIVGVVNNPSIGLFQQNVASTPAEWQSVDLTAQVNSLSNTGGVMQDLLSFGSLFVTMAIGAVKAFIAIAQAILLFSSTVLQAFPIFAESPLIVGNAAMGWPGLLTVFQIGEWCLFGLLAYNVFYLKNVFGTDF